MTELAGPTPTNVLHTLQETMLGRANLVLYLGATTGITTVDYHLSGDAFYSQPVQLENAGIHAALTKFADIDFDITIEKSFIAQGESYISISNGVAGNPGGSGWYAIVKLFHVNAAAAETQIATGTGRTWTTASEGNRDNIPLDVSTAKLFAIGEKLRCTVEWWASAGTSFAAGAQFGFGHDPQNRNGADVHPSSFTLPDSVGTIGKLTLLVNVFNDT